jgi:hypothetical protein
MKLVQHPKTRLAKNSNDHVLFDGSVDSLGLSTELGGVTIQLDNFHPANGGGDYVATLEMTVKELIELLARASQSRTDELRSLYLKLEK